MSFRIEEKINIKKGNLYKFYKWLESNSGYQIYPDRTVCSIYFDNQNLNMYNDSIEGTIPRKKIRIRTYNDSLFKKNKFNLEIKTTSVEGRFKQTKNIDNLEQKIKFGFFDQNYGICKPKIKIFYNRAYFKILNFRITLDTNINYSFYEHYKRNCNITKDESIIVEIKSQTLAYLNNIQENFPFQRIRFSKYCRGIEKLYFNSTTLV